MISDKGPGSSEDHGVEYRCVTKKHCTKLGGQNKEFAESIQVNYLPEDTESADRIQLVTQITSNDKPVDPEMNGSVPPKQSNGASRTCEYSPVSYSVKHRIVALGDIFRQNDRTNVEVV